MTTVADILKTKGTNTIYVAPTTPVIEALQLMNTKNIGSVLVLDNGVYAGILTERDYSRKVILVGRNSTETKCGEIMSTNLPELNPKNTIDDCMHFMKDKNIRYMPVFEGGKLAGIISMSDVVNSIINNQRETISQLRDYIHS